MHSLIPSSRTSRLIFGLILVGWVWPFPYFNTVRSDGTINNPNEVTRVYAVAALVDDGSWSIDAPIKRWGGVDDKAERDGKLYSSKAPGSTLLGAPAYALYRIVGDALDKRQLTFFLRVVVGIPASLFLLLLLHRELRRAGGGDDEEEPDTRAERWADGIIITAGLGSMIAPYTLIFAGHNLAAAAVFAAYVYGRRDDARGMLLFGLFAAAAPAMEYPHALAILPLGLRYLLAGARDPARIGRRIAFGLTGGALPIIATCIAQAKMFGHFTKTGYSFLENKAYESLHGAGFFGIEAPQLERIGSAFFSAELGLFLFTPLLLLGAFGLIFGPRLTDASPRFAPQAWLRDRGFGLGEAMAKERGWVLALIAVELLFLAGHGGWRGGWSIGPRYILPIVPFLFLGLPALPGALVGALAGASVLLCGLPSALYPHLSEVFSNPWASFVLPAIKSGLAPYQPGPYAAGASWGPGPILGLYTIAAALAARLAGGRNGLALLFPVLLAFSVVLKAIPERDPRAAVAERCRLYRLWEPRRSAPEGPAAAQHFHASHCRARGLKPALEELKP